jgi:hypothetical protein
VISAIVRSDEKELLGDQRGDLVEAWASSNGLASRDVV